MKIIFILSIFLITTSLFSQTIISGKVIDEKGKAVAGVNIFIEGTYDGSSSAEDGAFSFETSTTGKQKSPF